MAQQVDPWATFEAHKSHISGNTVDRLKSIIAGFNEECSHILSKTGKKQDLIDRIIRRMSDWRATGNVEEWNRARPVLEQVRSHGFYHRASMSTSSAGFYQPSSTQNIAPNIIPKSYPNPGVIPGPSGHARYDPYSSHRNQTATAAASSSSTKQTTIRFSPSPFFRADQMISQVVECPESISSMDRRSTYLNFTLTSDQIQKLASESPRYQLRLFCTSSQFYSPSSTSRSTQACPVEFPPTCEVRVNGTQLSANLKGLKKKPGTAPPADLGKAVRTTPAAQNRVEMIYVNSQQPIQSKKYYLVVFLVEVFTVEYVIDKLRKGKYRSCEEILASMRITMDVDDDIIAGPQKMSLKCPLSYVRISIPSRSMRCVHPQCFDALSWFSMMEQTTTWLCPVCEKVLSVEDIIVDGYFDNILTSTPESVEDVMVEADGEWHTTDHKYSSPGWHAPNAASQTAKQKAPADSARRPPAPVAVPIAPAPSAPQSNARPSQVTVVVVDSSDEEDHGRTSVNGSTRPQATGRSANANGRVTDTAQSANSGGVIDLTLDSDDERPEPPVRPIRTSSVGKRKDRDDHSPTDVILKRTRIDNTVREASSTGRETPEYFRSASPGAQTPLPSMPYASSRYTNSSLGSYSPPQAGNLYLPSSVPTRTNGFYGNSSPVNGGGSRPSW